MKQDCKISESQAKGLSERVGLLNDVRNAMTQYFSAVVDGQGLPEGTTFVSVDPTLCVLTVDVPDGSD